MSKEQRWCWVCEVCGFAWLANGEGPEQCASSKCRSRRWNVGGGVKPAILPVAVKKSKKVAPRWPRTRRQELPEAVAPAKVSRSGHDVKGCRLYRCGMCAGLGVKDARRGLQ